MRPAFRLTPLFCFPPVGGKRLKVNRHQCEREQEQAEASGKRTDQEKLPALAWRRLKQKGRLRSVGIHERGDEFHRGLTPLNAANACGLQWRADFSCFFGLRPEDL